ncbi:TetR/AcrR family transcriptional regulator [Streptomyces sp. NPDC056500]|uniref:TetR/AcrR family transcriptional regulator n=1 Tax=Streptomyces sp. NPDC056500 TaxID=3345840 RepID=UPI00368D2B0D
MGRPRGFDETEVVRSAAELFAQRSYDGISIDDLVTRLGLHRNSLYKTFGSKRGLYLSALRWSLEHDVAPLIDRMSDAADTPDGLREALDTAVSGSGLDLLLLAAVEQAPVDGEVAGLVGNAFAALDAALAPAGHPGGADTPPTPIVALTALLLGSRIRIRSTGSQTTRTADELRAALVQHLAPRP